MNVFAILEKGTVVQLINSESIDFVKFFFPDNAILEETSESGIAWVGAEVVDEKFVPPKPYNSWIFDEAVFDWVAPKKYPNDGNRYVWIEEKGEWVNVHSQKPVIIK